MKSSRSCRRTKESSDWSTRLHVVCSAASMVVINGEELQELWGEGGGLLFPTNVCLSICETICLCVRGAYTKETAVGVGHGAAQVPLTIPTCRLSFSFHELRFFFFYRFQDTCQTYSRVSTVSVILNLIYASQSAGRPQKRARMLSLVWKHSCNHWGVGWGGGCGQVETGAPTPTPPHH